ncbi:flagellar basal body L-ring protein FlgH [Thiohalorhabdus methylotrophus]|uniref:Flagellar L-ring protein n=1 Tax=Thiohalorhabdus methylotrophus TaxID=3242694 RepID=A0ABV4TXZ4_9GAMM
MTRKWVGALIVLLLVAGCAPRGGPDQQSPELEKLDAEVDDARLDTPDSRRNRSNEGSLWGRSDEGMFVDNKAREVGDIITVELSESAEGNNAASVEASREASSSGGISSLLGAEDKIPGEDPGNALEANSSNELSGDGETSRSTSLSGNMTAVVKQVFPNGNLRIEGQRRVTVNNEQQNMVLSGVIRQEDIASDNSISSGKIANARIQYAGEGVVARQQDEGWLTKLIHKFWPF